MVKLKVKLTVFVVSCLFIHPVQPRTPLLPFLTSWHMIYIYTKRSNMNHGILWRRYHLYYIHTTIIYYRLHSGTINTHQ